MADEPRSIQARIAALNLGQVNRGPSEAHAIVLGRPGLDNRRQTFQNPATSEVQSPSSSNGIGKEPNEARSNGVLPPPVITRTGQTPSQEAKPAGPAKMSPRRPSRSPALPSRRPSEQLIRRDSTESISSTISSVSALSTGTARTSTSRTPSMDGGRMRAPVYDPSTLPPLPPKKSPQEKEKDKTRIPLKTAKSTPNVLPTHLLPPPSMPALPPRPAAKQPDGNTKKLPPEAPPPLPRRPGPSLNLNGSHIPRETNGTTNGTSLHPAKPSPASSPPPIPLSSRPDLSKTPVSKPATQTSSTKQSCLKCRDFSAPDNHAATFPRQTVSSLDWLATHLTAPFPSPTDKARAIFTWLHHNIAYDVDAFFANNLKPSTPSSTLSSGLAVCEGYAALFTALATKAGLESLTISGHGKGFGFAPSAPNAPIPAQTSNHAWNGVRIDSGAWHLIDSCWGAGHISGPGQPYQKAFTPHFFTADPATFALRHFPANPAHFFLHPPPSWPAYIRPDPLGTPVRVFTLAALEGFDDAKILPPHLSIPTHPPATVRFQLQTLCAHWDPVRHGRGRPYVYILQTHGRDGREPDYVPLETDGAAWWADVPVGKLGARGQTVTLFAVESVDGGDGRGWSVREWREARGKRGMGFAGVCAWVLG